MKEAGYRLFYTGKWHVSNTQKPADYGWEGPSAGDADEAKPTLDEQNAVALERGMKNLHRDISAKKGGERRPTEIVRPGYRSYVHYGVAKRPKGDDKVIDSALEVLDELEGDDPWCLYVGPIGPHDPYFPPQRFLDMYEGAGFDLPDTFDDKMLDKPALYRRTRDRFDQLSREEHREAIKYYLAYCSYEDWLFGEVIDKLKERGDYDDAIVLYVSDHGDYVADHGLWAKGLPSFLTNYHVPAVMKVPDCDTGVVRDEFVSLCDFGPTFLELAGLKSPVEFTGQSLLPLLTRHATRDTGVAWRDAIFFQTNGNETYGQQRSILTDRWRFVYNAYDYDELYDMENDPGQVKNLNKDPEYESVRKEMYRRIWEFGLAHGEQLINGYIMTALADYGPGIALPGTNE